MSESCDQTLPELPRRTGACWTVGTVPQGLRTLPWESDVRCAEHAPPAPHPRASLLSGTESLPAPFCPSQFSHFFSNIWSRSAGKDLEELDILAHA